ncbi:MAG: signal recognition particle-docking protein FtsY [Desulfovibrio sp.]|jgi:fused signal recognition particle receptor|nr:signal recognition particle-docking protein FtsY [Desulfovibrio sp.]
MGFFSAVKRIFGGGTPADEAGGEAEARREKIAPALPDAGKGNAPDGGDAALTLRLREAEPRLSAWLAIILEGVDTAGELFNARLLFLLRALDVPGGEARTFVREFDGWLARMEYRRIEEFRSELQYRLALALDLEDEEDERNRLFLKISEGLARTREHLARRLDALFSGHGELDEKFWENMEEVFIMADMGYETSLALVDRLRSAARREGITRAAPVRDALRREVEAVFAAPRRITAVNLPEVVLMVGVNGVGKTTTIGKLAYRARLQGKKVMIAAADTFRAAAVEQLRIWAERAGALFHAGPADAEPAAVAYEAVEAAVRAGADVLFVDTAGRLQTKTNLMEELTKIRQVLGKKHPGAPHRTMLVIDATTGQNALSQTKLFRDASGVDELILTKLDGTAKGGIAIAVAMEYSLPISFVGLGEKLEDLRPFSGADYAAALLGEEQEQREIKAFGGR